MLLILLEALLAMLLLVGIVWWTMFSGRKGGEPPSEDGSRQPDAKGAEDAKVTRSTQKDSQEK